MSYDIKLDDNGDLAIENGDIVFFSGPSRVAQSIRLALGIVKGEYVFDTDYGIPLINIDAQGRALSTYLTDESLSDSQRHAFVLSYLNKIDGVDSVDSLYLDIDKKTRVLYIFATISTAEGPVDVKYGINSSL